MKPLPLEISLEEISNDKQKSRNGIVSQKLWRADV